MSEDRYGSTPADWAAAEARAASADTRRLVERVEELERQVRNAEIALREFQSVIIAMGGGDFLRKLRTL